MGKLGGLVLVVALGLTGCSAQTSPESSPAPLQGVAPLVAVPTATLAPEFTDPTNRDKFLAGVKKSPNAWRDGVIPSDDELLQGAAQACQLFAQGKTHTEIAALAGNTNIKQDNGDAIAVHASRNFCTKYNTDNL
jgi:hypothetical protein